MYIENGWLRAITFIFIWFLTVGTFQIAGFEILERSWNDPFDDLSVNEHLLTMCFSCMATLFTLIFFKKFVDREPLSEAGITAKHAWPLFGIGALTGVLVMTSGFFILISLGEIVVAQNPVQPLDLFKGVLIYLLVSLNEEFVMRGYIQVNLARSMNPYLALIISACLFSVLHIFNLGITDIGLLNLALSGILLGMSFLFIKNIWYSVGLHFTWNYFQGFIFGFHVSGIDNPSLVEVKYYEPNVWNGGVFGFEGSVICTILSIVSITLVYLYFRKYAAQLQSASVPAVNETLAEHRIS